MEVANHPAHQLAKVVVGFRGHGRLVPTLCRQNAVRHFSLELSPLRFLYLSGNDIEFVVGRQTPKNDLVNKVRHRRPVMRARSKIELVFENTALFEFLGDEKCGGRNETESPQASKQQ